MYICSYIHIHILLFIHGSPSGKRPDLQEYMSKKKNKRLDYLHKRNAILATNEIKSNSKYYARFGSTDNCCCFLNLVLTDS